MIANEYNQDSVEDLSRERAEVRQALIDRLRRGYRPYYSSESACDHNINWLALSREEFEKVIASELGAANVSH